MALNLQGKRKELRFFSLDSFSYILEKIMSAINIKGDITGGLTAGVVALPLCLAFGIASGLGAAAGLYGAIALSFFAAVFGGTRTQISGPTGPMTVVTASVCVALHGNLALICSVFLFAGLFQIIFGLLRVGKLVQYIPYPVISGFMNGVGLIIVLLQISPLLGGVSPNGTIDAIMNLGNIDIHIPSAILGIASLAIIYFCPKKVRAVFPPALLSLIVLTAVSYYLGLDVKTIGEIPSGLPTIALPSIDFENLTLILSYALILSTLGCIDSLLTSLVADSLTMTKHNSNRELIGQGIGNAMCGFVGGLVGAGATMRTVTNIKSGGNSRFSGVMSSLFLISVMFALRDLVAFVPIAVLSGILVNIGIGIFDYRLLKELKTAPKIDLGIMVLVFGLTVFVDLIFAVFTGVIAAALALIYQINHLVDVNVKVDKDRDLAICSIHGAFFFGSASKLARAIANQKCSNIIIDISSMPFVDLSGIYALEDEIISHKSHGGDVKIVLNKDQHLESLKALLGTENIFTNVESAEDSLAR
ncbi:MAG TPA: SulP family inorganic anion transporter [Succinivibrionaceae bacterium]|nr:SulP family inorganic anion transporter [Succinivibrionaceae bacterium]